jgi:hypothetical protein
MPTPAAAHQLVMSVAVNAAAELYDTMMGDNIYYDAWKKKNPDADKKTLMVRFVQRNWMKCVPVARATLAHMLTQPTITEEYKERIVEALELDWNLIAGRTKPAQIIGMLDKPQE